MYVTNNCPEVLKYIFCVSQVWLFFFFCIEPLWLRVWPATCETKGRKLIIEPSFNPVHSYGQVHVLCSHCVMVHITKSFEISCMMDCNGYDSTPVQRTDVVGSPIVTPHMEFDPYFYFCSIFFLLIVYYLISWNNWVIGWVKVHHLLILNRILSLGKSFVQNLDPPYFISLFHKSIS